MDQLTANEQLLVKNIGIIDYFNQHIATLDTNKFKPMSDARITSVCPFHSENDPSFHLWKKKNIFHCFGCGVGGNVVRLHMLTRQTYHGEKMDRAKTIKSLAQLYNINIEEVSEEVKSVFQIARETLSDKSIYVIPKDVLTLAEFRQLNNKVRSSNIPIEAKIANFEQLDLTASLFLADIVK